MRSGALWKLVILLVAPAPNLGGTVTVPFPKVSKTNQGQQELAGVDYVNLRTPVALQTEMQRGFVYKGDVC